MILIKNNITILKIYISNLSNATYRYWVLLSLAPYFSFCLTYIYILITNIIREI